MKKDKWFYPSHKQLPEPGQKVIYVANCNQLKEVVAWYDDATGLLIHEEGPAFELSKVKAWRKFSNNKNKYRWREMKDEKPKDNERIIWFFVDGVAGKPRIGTFIGIDYRRRDEIKIQGDVYLEQYFEGNIKWRKMCKLPGEK